MNRSVTKTFKWDAAHCLIHGYPDNCRNLHGHTYECSITVQLRVGAKLDKYGFVYDYNKMKGMKMWIDANLDHATLVAFNDTDLRNFLASQGGRNKHYVFEDQTSAEVISKHIFGKASEMFDDDRVFVSKITVKETCSSEAVYSI